MRSLDNNRPIVFLVLLIAAVAAIASGAGIFTRGGPGTFAHESIRGESVAIYGKGLYRDMSAEVAPQGIAQDVVTLFVAIPLLLISLRLAQAGSLRAQLLLGGTVAYFVVTYLFYLVMAMYNAMYLGYVILLGASVFTLAMVVARIEVRSLPGLFEARAPSRGAGIFLIANSAAIALLWLGVVLPPILTGEVVPRQVEHYTTLVVQGLDLSVLLPLGALSGWLLFKKRPLGFLLGPIYLVFLALLMTALTAKIVALGFLGYSIIPVIFIIPTLNVVAGVFAFRLLRSAQYAPTHAWHRSAARLPAAGS